MKEGDSQPASEFQDEPSNSIQQLDVGCCLPAKQIAISPSLSLSLDTPFAALLMFQAR